MTTTLTMHSIDVVAPEDTSSPPTSAANPDDAAQSPMTTLLSCARCALLHARRSGVALVPCGHSCFSGTCADIRRIHSGCPIHRSPITMVMRVFNGELNNCERSIVYAVGFA